MDAVSHGTPHTQWACERAMGEQQTVDRLAQVAHHMRSPNQQVRASAVRAIGEIGPPAAEYIPFLATMLADTSTQVRDAAQMSLAAITLGESLNDQWERAQVVTTHVAPFVRHKDFWVRQSAVETLGRLSRWRSSGTERGLLSSALDDTASPVRKAAVTALATIPPESLVALRSQIEHACQDKVPEVAAVAQSCLRRLNAQQGH